MIRTTLDILSHFIVFSVTVTFVNLMNHLRGLATVFMHFLSHLVCFMLAIWLFGYKSSMRIASGQTSLVWSCAARFYFHRLLAVPTAVYLPIPQGNERNGFLSAALSFLGQLLHLQSSSLFAPLKHVKHILNPPKNVGQEETFLIQYNLPCGIWSGMQ